MRSSPSQPWVTTAALITAGSLVLTGAAWSQVSGPAAQPTGEKVGTPAPSPEGYREQPVSGYRTQPGDVEKTGPLLGRAIEQPGRPTVGAGSTAGTPIPDEKLAAYVTARQRLERDDPSMRRAFETGDFAGRKDNLRAALEGTPLSVDEFIQIHRQVQSDPQLEARVRAQLGTSGAPAGEAGVTGPVETGAEPPAPSGAYPTASPQ